MIHSRSPAARAREDAWLARQRRDREPSREELAEEVRELREEVERLRSGDAPDAPGQAGR